MQLIYVQGIIQIMSDNETARKARETFKPSMFLDASNDIEAAIDYAYNLNNQNVILVGSSFQPLSVWLLEIKIPMLKQLLLLVRVSFLEMT